MANLMLMMVCVLTFASGCSAAAAKESNAVPAAAAVKPAEPNVQNPVDAVLTALNEKSRQIETYRGKIYYLFSQPLQESQTLRTGNIYYANQGSRSRLRIRFDTLKQDEEPQTDRREEWVFDGTTLLRVDYQLKSAEYRKLSEPNKPLNAFDLASQYLPIIGFAKADRLREDFDVTMAQQDAAGFIKLSLKTRQNSRYTQDYTHIDFWVDKHSSLPARMVATSPEGDVYDIKLSEYELNKNLPAGIFDVAVPADFGKNIVPLNAAGKEKEK
jgi:outer membrane lipoprotein-sorting protein